MILLGRQQRRRGGPASGSGAVVRAADPASGASWTLRAVGLADVLEAQGIAPEQVAFVWSDTQGCEADVIASGPSSVGGRRPAVRGARPADLERPRGRRGDPGDRRPAFHEIPRRRDAAGRCGGRAPVHRRARGPSVRRSAAEALTSCCSGRARVLAEGRPPATALRCSCPPGRRRPRAASPRALLQSPVPPDGRARPDGLRGGMRVQQSTGPASLGRRPWSSTSRRSGARPSPKHPGQQWVGVVDGERGELPGARRPGLHAPIRHHDDLSAGRHRVVPVLRGARLRRAPPSARRHGPRRSPSPVVYFQSSPIDRCGPRGLRRRPHAAGEGGLVRARCFTTGTCPRPDEGRETMLAVTARYKFTLVLENSPHGGLRLGQVLRRPHRGLGSRVPWCAERGGLRASRSLPRSTRTDFAGPAEVAAVSQLARSAR